MEDLRDAADPDRAPGSEQLAEPRAEIIRHAESVVQRTLHHGTSRGGLG
jgi:hypothetical protein